MDFVVGPYIEDHPSLQINIYEFLRNKAKDYADSIDRKLAEGPTFFPPHNQYGPVELWPLVKEERNDVIPG